jgi:hypothetical protein
MYRSKYWQMDKVSNTDGSENYLKGGIYHRDRSKSTATLLVADVSEDCEGPRSNKGLYALVEAFLAL